MNAVRSATCHSLSRGSMQPSPLSRNHRNGDVGVKVLSRTEYERIKTLSTTNIKEQQLREQETLIKERQERQRQYENLLMQTALLEDANNQEPQLTERQLELCGKLKKLRQEEEAEIRTLNQTIIEAKCLAQREQQILEKQQHVKDLKKMEQEMDRRVTLHQQEMDKKRQQLERERRQARTRYAELVKQQIEDNSKSRKKSQDGLREWEAKEIDKRVNTLELDKTREKRLFLEKQIKLREGLAECIEAKSKLQDTEKEAEMRRIQLVMRHRLEREEFEARVREEMKEKEKLRQVRSAYVSRLWQDCSPRYGSKEESNIRKAREQMDREWRDRELEKARENAIMQEKIRAARQEQLSQKDRIKRENENKERIVLDQIVKAGQEANEHEKVKQEQRTLERLRYSSEIRRQILENEAKNKQSKESQFREAEDYRKQVEEQRKVINKLKATKLEELKELNIPEKYVKEVARKTKIPWDDLSKSDLM